MNVDRTLSIIAIGLSVVSLGWQWWTWRRGSDLVTVSRNLTVVTGPAGVVGAAQVTASNAGRADVTVTGWGYELPGGDRIVAAATLPGSTELPYRLVGGSRGSWLMASDELLARCWKVGARHDRLQAFVELATGKILRARQNGIGLSDDGHDLISREAT